MLAYGLAIIIAIGSFSYYMAAFFVPEMHRRQDFVWSGLGMFYAVVLWFCAERITGAVLLGQTASVVLLGWLGWHTLELRRALTPEPVRTPVTWQDLQRWTQAVGNTLSEYLKLGSASQTIQSLWGELNRIVSDLRQRTAGPRGMTSDVPPLQRSPAYEFETGAGKSESVPSEFSTVSTRTREAAEPPEQPQVNESSEPDVSPSPETDTPSVEPLPTVEAELIDDSSEAFPPAPVNSPSPNPIQTDNFPATATAAAAPKRPKQSSNESSPQMSRPKSGVGGWLGSLVDGFRKPKPQRSVVDIPPRSPSIPRSPDATEAQTKKGDQATTKPQAKPQRGVIDIPPRPPSIPRSPKPDGTQPTANPPKGGRRAKPQRSVIDIPPRPSSIPRSPKPDGDQPAAQSPPPGSSDSANWLDVGDASADTANRPDRAAAPTSSASATPSPKQPADTNWPDETDTNWPDDEDTNWPD